MKRYTQQDLDNFEVVDGVRQCPSGDYTSIRVFNEQCSFAEGCSFAAWCRFAEACSFAEECSFAAWCSFAERCSFAAWCSFAERCSFAKECSFAEACSFAAWCRFAERCNIGGHTLKHSYVISVSGIGEYKRTLYLWITTDGIFCQAGCFFGSEEEFVIAVRNKYGENSAYEQSLNLLKGINNVT